MNDTQCTINRIRNNDMDAIISGVNSESPIVIMNAIIVGSKLKVKHEKFIEGLESAKKSEIILLGVPIKDMAVASLHLIGIERYIGDNSRIWQLIETDFQF